MGIAKASLGIITEATPAAAAHACRRAEQRRAYGFPSFAEGLEVCRLILRRGATPAVLRLYDHAESARTGPRRARPLRPRRRSTKPTSDCSTATMAVVDAECGLVGGTAGSDWKPVWFAERWMGLPQRRLGPGSVSTARGIVVDTIEIAARWAALPPLYQQCVAALQAIDGTLAASAHQSHAYGDGACLYFTFAGRRADDPTGADDPAGTDPAGTDTAAADAWAERYYEDAWSAVMDAVMAHGGAISHHHGIGINRAASHGPPSAPLDVLAADQSTPSTRPASSIQASSASPLPFGRARLAVSDRPVSILVVDVGTSGVRRRRSTVTADGSTTTSTTSKSCSTSPAPRLVEFDAATAMADAVLQVARRTLEAARSVDGWASPTNGPRTIVWDRAPGVPVGPGIGWQDLRNGGHCVWPCRPKASAWLPTNRPPSWPCCSIWPTPTAAATCASAPSTPGWPGRALSSGALYRDRCQSTPASTTRRRHAVAVERLGTTMLEALRGLAGQVLPTVVDSSAGGGRGHRPSKGFSSHLRVGR